MSKEGRHNIITTVALGLGLGNVCLTFAQANESGLQMSAAVDAVGEFKLNKESEAGDLFRIRGTELTFYSPIDHIFDGKLSLAAHWEPGESIVELHEATIGSAKLIPRTSFRIGQYFLGIGRLNRFHQHDWPFVSTPKVHEEFFDKEGVIDSGGELSYLLPLPFFVDITAGVTNGWVYGHTHDEGEKPNKPTHYARIGSFWEATDQLGVALGLNFLSRKSADGQIMTLYGIDWTAKFRGSGYNIILAQAEIWQRQLVPDTGETRKELGGYFYPEYCFSKAVAFGSRFDYFTVSSLKDGLGRKVENSETSLVPTLTYRSSEFATFRLEYNHTLVAQERQSDRTDRAIRIQSVFILGAHPAHDF